MEPFKNKLSDIKTKGKSGILSWINLENEFNVKRIFTLSNFNDLVEENKYRGLHKNTDFNEILILISGSINITLTKDKSYNYKLVKNEYVYIPKNYYLTIEILSKDTNYLVLADNKI